MALDPTAFPLREFHKAKRLHWNPQEIYFSLDHDHWTGLSERDRGGTLQLCSLFLIGEEAVTHDLAPLLIGVRERGGMIESELFLTAQLYEEAKHTEFFDRWLTEVAQQNESPASHVTPSYRILFLEKLPTALRACLHDTSPLTLARASVVYHMIIEGVMAETGYYLFTQAMAQRALFPGLLAGVQKVQQDEARHLAFGLWFIRAMVQADPAIWPALVATLNEGLMLATGALSEALFVWGNDMPFDIDTSDALAYAARQFTKRYTILEQGIDRDAA